MLSEDQMDALIAAARARINARKELCRQTGGYCLHDGGWTDLIKGAEGHMYHATREESWELAAEAMVYLSDGVDQMLDHIAHLRKKYQPAMVPD